MSAPSARDAVTEVAMKFFSAVSKTRIFFAGALAGALAIALGNMAVERGGATRTPTESAMYDECLVQRNGNVTACDAMLRVYARAVAHDDAMKAEAEKMIAAGRSKQEVVRWGFDHELYGSSLAEAVGISVRDLQTGNYLPRDNQGENPRQSG
jgi:hypothetical protein